MFIPALHVLYLLLSIFMNLLWYASLDSLVALCFQLLGENFVVHRRFIRMLFYLN